MTLKTIQDNEIRVDLRVEESTVMVVVTDRQTARAWGPVPLLAFDVYDRMQDRVEELRQFKVEALETLPQGFHVVMSVGSHKVAAGLWLKIVDGELSVMMQPAEVYEYEPLLYRMFAVDVLPGLMEAGVRGEMLLPVNTGVVCKPGGKPKLADRFMIYGEQSRWELMPTLPLCAVQTPTGGLVAVATGGAAETQCRVATDGKGNGTVGLAFFLRGRDPDPVEPAQRELRFTLMPAKVDMCVCAAKRLRKHVMEDLGKKTLRKRAEESPEVAHLLNAYIMKLFYGIQKQGLMFGEGQQASAPKFQTVMTFDEASAALKKLHEAGVDRVYTQNVGWNYRGHDGAYPTRFPIEERVGGEAAFRHMIAQGHALGYQMTVHDNYTDAYASSPDFDPQTLAWDIYGQPQVRGFWGGGVSYLQWPLSFAREDMEGPMMKLKEMGIRGPYYLDGMGSPLYINYHPRHRGSRSDHARGLDRILQMAKKLFGSAATETGFLYCSITPDLIANPGNEWHMKLCKPEWPVTGLLDRRVPVWNLAMSGLILVENQGMDWVETMQAALLGLHPRVEWSTRPGIMPVLEKPLIMKIKARHDLLIKELGHLRTCEMVEYGVEDKVETSKFDDGTIVVADFGKEELFVNGKQVVRPEAL